jgi:hypothetical protein
MDDTRPKWDGDRRGAIILPNLRSNYGFGQLGPGRSQTRKRNHLMTWNGTLLESVPLGTVT